jgi:hypothetical protein
MTTKGTKTAEQKKLSHLEFTILAIKKLRTGTDANGKPYLGIHATYSGYNDAFRQYFGVPPVSKTDKVDAKGRAIWNGPLSDLIAKGQIISRPAHGGIFLYIPTELPVAADKGSAALKKLFA